MTLVLVALAAWYLWPRLQGAVAPPPGALQPCQLERMDGPYRICLNRDSEGRWSWTASRAGEPPLAADNREPSDDDALADAWVTLQPKDIGGAVTSEAREVGGMRLATDGTLTIIDQGTYVPTAAQIITNAAATNDEPLGVVGALLTQTFGSNWNPLRVRIAGGTIWDAAKRYQDEKAKAATTPARQARAIAGLA